MSSTKFKLAFIGLLALVFETLLFHAIRHEIGITSPRFMGIVAIYQSLFIIGAWLIHRNKSLIFANTIVLLLIVNLLLPNFDKPAPHISLQPYYSKNITFVGDVMPGLHGINKISTDDLGFRHSAERVNYKSNSNYRIFTIGASTTEELFLDDQETWSSQLEFNLKKIGIKNAEVINTGVSGLRASNHYSTQRFVEQFNPNLLIFLVGVNDWNHYIRSIIKNRGTAEKPIFAIEPINTPSPSSQSQKKNLLPLFSETILFKSAKYLENLAIYWLPGAQRYLKGSDNDPILRGDKKHAQKIEPEDGYYFSKQNDSLNRQITLSLKASEVSPQYANDMSMIAARCKSQSYKCMFVNQPSAYHVDISPDLKKRLWMTPPNEVYTLDLNSLISIASTYNQWLVNFSLSQNIPVCNIANQIPATTKFLFDDVHFTEAGSTLVMKKIFNCLERGGLIQNSKS